MKKTCKWLLLAVLTLCLTLAVGVALAAGVDDWNNATTAQTFTLTGNIEQDKDLLITAPITIDLNGKTLTITKTDNQIGSNVTIKNGTIELKTTDYETGIFLIGYFYNSSITSGQLTLDKVTVKGNNFSTSNGVFSIGNNGEVVVQNSRIDLKNDTHKDGGVFKANSDVTAKLSIIGSEVTLDNIARGILGCDVTIKNSTFTAQNMFDNVFNSSESYLMDMTIDNSKVTLKSGTGESVGLKMGGDSYIHLVNGSTLDVGFHAEGAFVARSGFKGQIKLQGKGNTLAVDVPFKEMMSYVDYSEDNYEFTENTEKAFTISPKKEEKPVVAPTVAPTAAPAASVPQTGDNSQLGLWFALLLLSGVAIAVAMKKQPKGSNK